MEAEKCFFALVLLVLICCFPELAVTIGCVTKDWDCDEGRFCSLRDNRCKECSEIAQYFCNNLTEIQARFKECINYCFEWRETQWSLERDALKEMVRNMTAEVEQLRSASNQTEWDEHPLMIPVAIGASSFIGGAVIGAIIGAILVQKLRPCKNRRGQNEGTQQADPELTLMVPPVTLSAPDDEQSEGYRTDTSPEATPPSPRAASPHPCDASTTVTQPVANDSGDLAL